MAAVSAVGEDGCIGVSALALQHSSLIAPLAMADGLLVRPPHAPALATGSLVPMLPLEAP
jgi:molybdopterin molybdotransferase